MRKKNEMQDRWLRTLEQTMKEYEEAPGSDKCINNVFSVLLDGLVQDLTVNFACLAVKQGDCAPDVVLQKFRNGNSHEFYYAVITDGSIDTLLPMKLRKAFMKVIEEDRVNGIVIDPDSDYPFLLTRNVVESVSALYVKGFDAGAKQHPEEMSVDLSTPELPGEHYAVSCPRPCSESCGEALVGLMDALNSGYHVCDTMEVRFQNYVEDDAVDCLRIRRFGNDLCHVELDFDMSDFNWDHPLTLGADLSRNHTEEVIRALCCEGISSGDIPLIYEKFMDLTEKSE